MLKRTKILMLNSEMNKAIDQILHEIMKDSGHIELHAFLEYASMYAQELPREIRRTFYEFKLMETNPILIVKNNIIDEERLGPTPNQLPVHQAEYIQREEALHILYALLLGEPFAWHSIQRGHIINEVFPVKDNADLVVSSGSKHTLGLHTEDAFDKNFGEYLGLMCIRNTYETPTWFSFIDEINLSDDMKSILFEKRFKITANPAHHINKIEEKSAILFGDFNSPYIRVNFNFIEHQTMGDKEATWALTELKSLMEQHSFSIALEKGDYMYINNLKIAHGRKKYSPHFDGKDRWMKRLYITESLKKSREFRSSPSSRVILPQNCNASEALQSKI